MSLMVVLAVLGAALAQAFQNCAIKSSADPVVAALLLPVVAGLFALPILVLAPPDPTVLPWLLASSLLNLVYWIALGRAYAGADVGLVFPMTRGLIPAFVIAAGFLVSDRVPTPLELVATGGLLGGIVMIVGALRPEGSTPIAGIVLCCLLASGSAAGFLFCDHAGSLLAGSALRYVAALYASNAILILAYGLVFRRRRFLTSLPAVLPTASVWGPVSLAAYAVVIWASSQAPLGLVASLRESSVVFVAVIAPIWLREPLRPMRLAGAGLVGAALVALRYA